MRIPWKQIAREKALARAKSLAEAIPPVPPLTSHPGVGLGDLVSPTFTKIARHLKLPCIDPATQELKPESNCQKRKQKMNKIRIPRLWPKSK